jgi:hypothetical protein
VSASGWLNVLAARAADGAAADGAPGGVKHKSCILLWMAGGPSHKDTFDPKSDSDGDVRPIATAVPGIQVSEHFPNFAPLMRHAAIIRGMSTPEADHQRASYHLHTGYRLGLGGLQYPSLGSIVSAEFDRPDFELPHYVLLGHSGKADAHASGFLGPRHEPLKVPEGQPRGRQDGRGAGGAVPDTAPLGDWPQFEDRVSLLQEMERGFYKVSQAPLVDVHRTTYERAVRLMRAPQLEAFDVSGEPAAVQAAYGIAGTVGPNRKVAAFGTACLQARRLVEAGVPFVEVVLGTWDHHNNIAGNHAQAAVCDVGMAALVDDLRQRGLLDETLVIWMGEFGRTPKVNKSGGRDHYARAWSAVLVGGGIRGGQVVGKTDDHAAEVVERPVSVTDLLATVCEVLGIDHTKENQTPVGRPVRLVEAGADPITDLLT